jgi:hypothetical protein
LADKYCVPVKINMPLIINKPFLNISPLGVSSGNYLRIFSIISGLEKVSKNCPYSDQIGRQIDHQIRFWSGLFGGGAAESYDSSVGGCVVV